MNDSDESNLKELRNTLYGLQKIQLFFILPVFLAVIVSAISLNKTNVRDFLNHLMMFLSIALPFATYGKLRKSKRLSVVKIFFIALLTTIAGIAIQGVAIYLAHVRHVTAKEAGGYFFLSIAFLIYLLRFFFIISVKKR